MFIRDGTPSGFSTISSGRAVRQERHILLRKNTGNDTLVSVTARHLIADGNLALLCDVNADNHG